MGPFTTTTLLVWVCLCHLINPTLVWVCPCHLTDPTLFWVCLCHLTDPILVWICLLIPEDDNSVFQERLFPVPAVGGTASRRTSCRGPRRPSRKTSTFLVSNYHATRGLYFGGLG